MFCNSFCCKVFPKFPCSFKFMLIAIFHSRMHLLEILYPQCLCCSFNCFRARHMCSPALPFLYSVFIIFAHGRVRCIGVLEEGKAYVRDWVFPELCHLLVPWNWNPLSFSPRWRLSIAPLSVFSAGGEGHHWSLLI